MNEKCWPSLAVPIMTTLLKGFLGLWTTPTDTTLSTIDPNGMRNSNKKSWKEEEDEEEIDEEEEDEEEEVKEQEEAEEKEEKVEEEGLQGGRISMEKKTAEGQ